MTDPVPLIPDPAPGETPRAYSVRLIALQDEITARVQALQPARDDRLERARAAQQAAAAAVARLRATADHADAAAAAAYPADAGLRAAADAAHHEWMALHHIGTAASQAARDAFEPAAAGRELLVALGSLVQDIRLTVLSDALTDDDARWTEIRHLLHDARPRLAALAPTALADPVPAYPTPLIPDPLPGETPESYSHRLGEAAAAAHAARTAHREPLRAAWDAARERLATAQAAAEAADERLQIAQDALNATLAAAPSGTPVDAGLRQAFDDADTVAREAFAAQKDAAEEERITREAVFAEMDDRRTSILNDLFRKVQDQASFALLPDDAARWAAIHPILAAARAEAAALPAPAGTAVGPVARQVPAVPGPPDEWTDAARARLALSAAAAELADDAARIVPTSGGPHGRDIRELLERVDALAGAADYLRRLAVIYARERSQPWGDIGEAFGVTRQTAHARFADIVETWRDNLYNPDRHTYSYLDEGAYNPAQTAEELNRWLARHHHGDGPAPTVTAGLTGYDAMTRARETLARAARLSKGIVAGTASPAAIDDHEQRKAVALTEISAAHAARLGPPTQEEQP